MALRQVKRALPTFLRPAWFDEARRELQGSVFERLSGPGTFHGKVLNAGCGEGLYAGFLENFPRVTSIVNLDVSLPRVSTLRADPRHRDLQGTLTALPFESASFDGCLCSEVLEHIPDDAQAVRELARCLRPGAALLLSVPTPPAPQDPAHVREGYSLEAVTGLLEAHGFKVEGHAFCLRMFSRILYWTWQQQRQLARRNIFPRGALQALTRLEQVLPVGKPWDVVVLARRTSNPAAEEPPRES